MECLQDCITTLPLTPVENLGLGMVLTPFLMEVLSKNLRVKSVLSLNVNGLKINSSLSERMVSGFLDQLKLIDIKPDGIWLDDSPKNIFWIKSFFNQLITLGYVIKGERDLLICSCGRVEMLAIADNWSQKRALSFEKDGDSYCKFCNKKLSIRKSLVYLFRLPNNLNFDLIYPAFYRKELENLFYRFMDYEFLISRLRDKAFVFDNDGEIVSLDVDFVWQLYLPLLRRLGYNPIFLIGGNKNLMASGFAMIMSSLLDGVNTSLFVPPYYKASKGKSLKDEEYYLKNLTRFYSAKDIRILLATAFNWKRKESVIDFSLLNLISKLSYRVHSSERALDLGDLFVELEGRKLKLLLSEVKKDREKHVLPNFFGII